MGQHSTTGGVRRGSANFPTRNVIGLAAMAVGAITEPAQVNTIVACRRADLVALARPHLVDPAFTWGAGKPAATGSG